MIFTYEFMEQTYTINLEPRADSSYLVMVDGRQYHVTVGDGVDGSIILTIAGQQVIVHTAAQDNQRFVHLDGQTFTVTVPDSRTRRSSSTSGGGLTAQMPGQVIEMLVAVGDAVESGQTMLIMEAMKMEIRLTAPQDGTIKQIRVQVGDVVDRGQQLIEIAPC